ncbi:SDR family oxidoreductase [Lachnospiraceae bacterium KK002]
MPHDRILEGKNAIVTGTSSGIGKATVEIFAQNGANIWACMRRKDLELEKFFLELASKNNIWIKILCFDMNSLEGMRSAVMDIKKEKVNIDILVNNAGTTYDALLPMLSIEKSKELFETNFYSHIQFTQFVSRLMMKVGKGCIVNTGSYLGIEGNRGQVMYSATKAAIHAMTKSLSKELSDYGIRVNAVAPGVVNTKLISTMTRNEFENIMNHCSLKRFGEPEEIANMIMILASDLSSYVTGQIIRVDGGM